MRSSDLVLALLQDPKLQGLSCSNDLINHAPQILTAFHNHPHSYKLTLVWASSVMKARYVKLIAELSGRDNRWHFGALHASTKQLKEFKIEEMAEKMEDLAPELWDLLGLLLSADTRQTQRRQRDANTQEVDTDLVMGTPDGMDSNNQIHVVAEDDPMAEDVNIGDSSNPNYGQSFGTAAE